MSLLKVMVTFVFVGCFCTTLRAELMLDITGTSGEGLTTWTLSGNSVSTGADYFDDGMVGQDDSWFDFPDLFATNFSDVQYVTSSGGSITTGDGTRSVDTVFLDNDTANGDELGLGVTGNSNLDFATNSLVSWTGSFTVAVDIDDFNIGTFSSSDFGGSGSGILPMTIRVSAVPEPSLGILSALSFCSACGIRRRKH